MGGLDSTRLAWRSSHEGPTYGYPLYFPVTTLDYRLAQAGRRDMRPVA
jgi:hypothetical protein